MPSKPPHGYAFKRRNRKCSAKSADAASTTPAGRNTATLGTIPLKMSRTALDRIYNAIEIMLAEAEN